MPTLTVALDGARRRDLQMVAGDELLLDMAVYEYDGDPNPVAVSNLTFNLTQPGDNVSVPLGNTFTAPDDPPGRRHYVIKGDVAGYTRTLVYGVLEVLGATGYLTGNLGIGFVSGGGVIGNLAGPVNGMIDENGNFMVDEFGNFIVS